MLPTSFERQFQLRHPVGSLYALLTDGTERRISAPKLRMNSAYSGKKVLHGENVLLINAGSRSCFVIRTKEAR
jgi:hypothetical protein